RTEAARSCNGAGNTMTNTSFVLQREFAVVAGPSIEPFREMVHATRLTAAVRMSMGINEAALPRESLKSNNRISGGRMAIASIQGSFTCESLYYCSHFWGQL